jgi:hypothetical protein
MTIVSKSIFAAIIGACLGALVVCAISELNLMPKPPKHDGAYQEITAHYNPGTGVIRYNGLRYVVLIGDNHD